MPVQLRVASWNIQKKGRNAVYVAELMRLNQIDICALLEVPNGKAVVMLTAIVAALNNLAPAYHANEWVWHAVNVGGEAVAYIWHQTAAVGVNAFQADIKAIGVQRVAGPVTHDTANNPIYFPKTGSKWPGANGGHWNGRRPAYLAFVTNDGAAARRFTVLDLHTPFNPASSIQSYATSVYATAREVRQVDRNDIAATALAASAGLAAMLAPAVTAVITTIGNHAAIAIPNAVCNAAVQAAAAAIDEQTDLAAVLTNAAIAGARAAVSACTPPVNIPVGDANALAQACAMAGAGAAALMVATAQLPTAPPPAMVNPVAAKDEAVAAARNEVGQFRRAKKNSFATVMAAIRNEAGRIADIAVEDYTFAALPLTAVTAAIVAGDFNVNYPDNSVYQAAQRTALGGPAANAYTRMLALVGAARNTLRTTRTGPSAFLGKRIYTLRVPCPIQSTTPGQPDYVPLNMAPLQANVTNFVDNDNWINGLRAMAQTQGLPWATIINDPGYTHLLDTAFDMEVIDATQPYFANCYDNIFVRGAVVNAAGTIDVLSALGSWPARVAALPNPQPALAHNPWLAAGAGLNPLAQAQLGALVGPLTYTYYGTTYTITAALADAEEAAIFSQRIISDHLPVFVQVTL